MDASNWTELLLRTMKIASQFQEFSGQEKKEYVMNEFKKMVADAIPDDQPFLERLAQDSLSLIIDSFIKVNKKEIVLVAPKCRCFNVRKK